MSGHTRGPCPQPHHTGHSGIRASRCRDHPPGPRRMQQHDDEHREHHGQHWPRRAGHPHRGGFDIRRPVLLPGLRPIPPAAPSGHRDLFRRGQQRGHRRDQRPAGQLRRLRRAHERQRASSRQRRPGHPGARRPGRRRRGLQPEPPGRRPAAPDRPGPRGHLPRADHHLERPGHHRAQPGPAPASARRSPSCTAPTAAAPPTSSATTCPASARPGRPRSAPARR